MTERVYSEVERSEAKARLKGIWDIRGHDPNAEGIDEYYNQWASTYDKDCDVIGYVGPTVAAEHFAKHATQLGLGKDVRILDVGAGTGQPGEKLYKNHGFWNLEANDANAKMLDVAREKGIYKQCHTGRIQDLSLPAKSYDAVISVGTSDLSFLGHIVKLIKPGGLLVSVMNAVSKDVNQQYLEAQGALECLEDVVLQKEWYLDDDAWVLAFKII